MVNEDIYYSPKFLTGNDYPNTTHSWFNKIREYKKYGLIKKEQGLLSNIEGDVRFLDIINTICVLAIRYEIPSKYNDADHLLLMIEKALGFSLPSNTIEHFYKHITERINWRKQAARKNWTISRLKLNKETHYEKIKTLSEIIFSRDYMDGNVIYLIKAAHATGKTEQLIQQFINLWSCIIVAHRRLLCEDHGKRLNADVYSYSDRKIEDDSDKGLKRAFAICLNSLAAEKHDPFLRNKEAFIIDEFSQILDSLANLSQFGSDSDTKSSMGSARDIYNALKGYIRRPNMPVLLVDANINTFDINWVESIAEETSKKVVVVEVEEASPANLQEIVISRSVGKTIKLAAIDAEEFPMLIFSTTKNSIDALELEINRRHESMDDNGSPDMIKVTSDTTSTKAVTALIRDINEESEKYQVLAASPSIISGNSITNNYFKNHYGIATPGVLTERDIEQQWLRDRGAYSITVAFDLSGMYSPTRNAYVRIKKYERLLESIKSELEEDGINVDLKTINPNDLKIDGYTKFSIERMQRIDESAKDCLNRSVWINKDRGRKITFLNDCNDKGDSKYKREVSNDRALKLADAPLWSYEEYEKCKRNDELGLEENKEAVESYQLRRELGFAHSNANTSLELRDVKWVWSLLGKNFKLTHLKEFEYMIFKKYDIASIEEKNNGLSFFNKNHKWRLYRYYRRILISLGLFTENIYNQQSTNVTDIFLGLSNGSSVSITEQKQGRDCVKYSWLDWAIYAEELRELYLLELVPAHDALWTHDVVSDPPWSDRIGGWRTALKEMSHSEVEKLAFKFVRDVFKKLSLPYREITEGSSRKIIGLTMNPEKLLWWASILNRRGKLRLSGSWESNAHHKLVGISEAVIGVDETELFSKITADVRTRDKLGSRQRLIINECIKSSFSPFEINGEVLSDLFEIPGRESMQWWERNKYKFKKAYPEVVVGDDGSVVTWAPWLM